MYFAVSSDNTKAQTGQGSASANSGNYVSGVTVTTSNDAAPTVSINQTALPAVPTIPSFPLSSQNGGTGGSYPTFSNAMYANSQNYVSEPRYFVVETNDSKHGYASTDVVKSTLGIYQSKGVTDNINVSNGSGDWKETPFKIEREVEDDIVYYSLNAKQSSGYNGGNPRPEMQSSLKRIRLSYSNSGSAGSSNNSSSYCELTTDDITLLSRARSNGIELSSKVIIDSNGVTFYKDGVCYAKISKGSNDRLSITSDGETVELTAAIMRGLRNLNG
jgi:hypothetical protein